MIVECDFIEIETYALGAGVDDRIWRCDMAFELREIAVRMMVTNPPSIISLAPEWFGFHARERNELVSCFGAELPLQKMYAVSICIFLTLGCNEFTLDLKSST
jgi:hypothetical protein